MTTAVKEEVWEITDSTPSISANDLAAISADKSLQIVWEYEVPVGVALIFTAEDILSAYLEDDTSDTEMIGTTTRVAVSILDSSRHNMRSVMNPTLYTNVKEFAEENKLKRLDIATGDQIIANEGERLVIQVAPPAAVTTFDASDSYFRLTCKRARHSLFE